MEKLTFQEEETMLIIWKKGSGVIKDFRDQMDDPKPPYTTIASIIKNLERKQYLKSKRYGNIYEYTPIITEGEYKKRFMSGIVNNYFANSYKEMVSFFAKEEKISAEELEEIIRMINKQ